MSGNFTSLPREASRAPGNQSRGKLAGILFGTVAQCNQATSRGCAGSLDEAQHINQENNHDAQLLDSTVYGIHNSDDTIRIVNTNGSAGAAVSNVANYNGLGADAALNVLFAAGPAGVHRIDLINPNPATNSTSFAYGGFVDGITVSPDGSIVYLTTFENGTTQIQGFNAVTGALLYRSAILSGGAATSLDSIRPTALSSSRRATRCCAWRSAAGPSAVAVAATMCPSRPRSAYSGSAC